MKIRSFEDVEKYLANQQVYFKKEIVSIDFKTIAEELRVHNVGKVDAKRISDKYHCFHCLIANFFLLFHFYFVSIQPMRRFQVLSDRICKDRKIFRTFQFSLK